MTDSNLHLLAIVIFITLLLIIIAIGATYTAKLKASEELWKFALEGSGDGVWDWDIVKDIALDLVQLSRDGYFCEQVHKKVGANG